MVSSASTNAVLGRTYRSSAEVGVCTKHHSSCEQFNRQSDSGASPKFWHGNKHRGGRKRKLDDLAGAREAAANSVAISDQPYYTVARLPRPQRRPADAATRPSFFHFFIKIHFRFIKCTRSTSSIPFFEPESIIRANNFSHQLISANFSFNKRRRHMARLAGQRRTFKQLVAEVEDHPYHPSCIGSWNTANHPNNATGKADFSPSSGHHNETIKGRPNA